MAIEIREEYLEGQDGAFRYWQSRPNQGLPVIFVHGYGGTIEHWQRIFPKIAAKHTIYALDLYGFGASAYPKGGTYSGELWARQLATLVTEVVQGPAVVVGHSMGGIAVAEFAHHYPHLTQGLVLVNSAGLARADLSPAFLEQFVFELVQTPLIGELLSGVFANPFSIWASLQTAYHNKQKVTLDLVELFNKPLRRRGAIEAYLAVSRAFSSYALAIKPGAVQAPTLIIWGQEDLALPPSLAERFKAEIFPQAQVYLVPQTGHCPFDEAPETFCQGLLPWLEELST